VMPFSSAAMSPSPVSRLVVLGVELVRAGCGPAARPSSQKTNPSSADRNFSDCCGAKGQLLPPDQARKRQQIAFPIAAGADIIGFK
jgi:hypothetical protein